MRLCRRVRPLFPPPYGRLLFLKWRIATHYWHKVRDKKQTFDPFHPYQVSAFILSAPSAVYWCVPSLGSWHKDPPSKAWLAPLPSLDPPQAPCTETPGALLYIEQHANSSDNSSRDTPSPAQPEATAATTSSHLHCPAALGLWEQKRPEEKMESCNTWPRILLVGTDLLAGPQKVWLAISFPMLLPAKPTACQGWGGRVFCEWLPRTAQPYQDSQSACFLTDTHSLPFPDQRKTQSIVTSTAAPSAQFVPAARRHPSPSAKKGPPHNCLCHLYFLWALKRRPYQLYGYSSTRGRRQRQASLGACGEPSLPPPPPRPRSCTHCLAYSITHWLQFQPQRSLIGARVTRRDLI